MGPWLILLCIMAAGIGLWVRAGDHEETVTSPPDAYTAGNIRVGGRYHVEQNGLIQEFEVLASHWSGYFQIRLAPPEEHELDRDYPVVVGWTRELLSNRLIEAGHLLQKLPVELSFSAN